MLRPTIPYLFPHDKEALGGIHVGSEVLELDTNEQILRNQRKHAQRYWHRPIDYAMILHDATLWLRHSFPGNL